MSVDPTPAAGPGGLSKRTLLIGAIAIGGVAGLFIFLSNRASKGTADTGTPEGTGTFDAGAVTLASLANQVLQFRGEQSMANADLTAQIGEGFAGTTKESAGLAAQLGLVGASVSNVGREVIAQSEASNLAAGQRQNRLVELLNIIAGRSNEIIDRQQFAQSQLTGIGGQLTGLGGMVQGVGGQLRDIRIDQQAQGRNILGVIDRQQFAQSQLTGIGGQLTGLGGMAQGIGGQIRALTALGEQSSIYGAANTERLDVFNRIFGDIQASIAREPMAAVSPSNPNNNNMFRAQIVNPVGTLSRSTFGGTGALSGAVDAGDGDLFNWLDNFYTIPIRRV